MNKQPEYLNILSRSDIFCGLNNRDLQSLALKGKTLKLPARECLFKEGDISRDVFVILTGEIGVRCNVLEEKDNTLPFKPVIVKFGPGEIMGEFSLADGEPRSADAVAIMDSTVFSLSHSMWEEVIASEPATGCMLLKNLNHILASRVRRTSRQLMAALEWNWKTAKFDKP